MRLYVDPLYAELIPDGTFGGVRPTRGQRTQPAEPVPAKPPDPDAARHVAELLAALDQPRRHLRAVPPAA